MADTGTANPEAGADINSEADAVSMVSGMLSEPSGPTEADAQEAQEPAPESGDEVLTENSPSDGDAAEAEPDDGDATLPDTLVGLAGALDISADDLAGHVRVPVTVNGEVQHVTIADAMKGHQLQADYTRKTQELAEERLFCYHAATNTDFAAETRTSCKSRRKSGSRT